MIRDASLVHRAASEYMGLQVVVAGDPEAFLFKNLLHVDVQADVCGECGLVELQAADPGALYQHYLKSRGLAVRPAPRQKPFSSPCAGCGMLVPNGAMSCPHCGTGDYGN